MEKKTLYTIVGLGAVGLISFQAFNLINSNNQGDGNNNSQRSERSNNREESERSERSERSEKSQRSQQNGKGSNWNKYGLVNVETTFDTETNNYVSTMTYNVEEDTNTLTLVVTLTDNVIDDVQISHYDDSPKSKQKHDLFDNKVNLDEVLGVTIEDAQIANVTGASYTSAAFNEILLDISNNLEI